MEIFCKKNHLTEAGKPDTVVKKKETFWPETGKNHFFLSMWDKKGLDFDHIGKILDLFWGGQFFDHCSIISMWDKLVPKTFDFLSFGGYSEPVSGWRVSFFDYCNADACKLT